MYMVMYMSKGRYEIRTQVYLTSDQHFALKTEAERKGTTMAEIIREAVSHYVAAREKEHLLLPDDPLWSLVGMGKGDRDLALHHDHYLYGSPRRK